MVEVSLTVGKLDASLALLLTKEHHLIEFPTVLLPDGVSAGSVVTIRCEQNADLEQEEAAQFDAVQEEILQLFGTHEPKTPNLRIKNVTQTSAVLEWDPLDLGSASIKALTLYKNGTRLGQVPNPLVSTTTKLSGLPVDTPYEFHLRLDTTAGVYVSEKVKLKTHKMTDLSGITVCLGDIDPAEGITREQIEESLKNIGARAIQTEVAVDTTHFITTAGLGQQWRRAVDSNIPVVRPEWLRACEQERRIVGVRNFYLDADPKFLSAHKFTTDAPKEAEPEPVQEEVKEEPLQETRDEAVVADVIPEVTPVSELHEDKAAEIPVPVEETPAEETSPTEEPAAEPMVQAEPPTEAIVEETVVAEVPEASLPVEPTPVIEEDKSVEESTLEEEPEIEVSVKPVAEPEATIAVSEAPEEQAEPITSPQEDFDEVDIGADAQPVATEQVKESSVEAEGDDAEEAEEEDTPAEADLESKPVSPDGGASKKKSNKKKNKKKGKK